ncbi:MAG TPA: DUF1707 domain-containing protein [Streptosporangiaceae bacterium]|jgi:hypothetical protein
MNGEVSPLGRGDGGVPDGLRASHADRDRVVDLLRVAAGDGRLTSEELDQRLELALNARTYGELAALTTDLPAAPGTAAAPAPAKDVVLISTRSGSARRDGRWTVPRRIEVRVRSGSVKLDLTEAVLTHPVLEIDAEVGSGSLAVITRPGVVVDADDVEVRSGSVRAKSPWNSRVPVTLRIHVSGKVGSGHISVRPPYRSFWQWLTRRPRRYAEYR